MNAKEKAALADFVATVVWPGRTVRAVTTPGGEQDFTLTAAWDSDHDTPMAWIDGNRVPTGSITWQNITETVHNEGQPDEYVTHSSSTVRLQSVVPYGRLVIILISPGAGAGYMPRNPDGATFLDDVDFGGKRGKHLAPSEEPDDAVRRDEVVAIAKAMVGANYALLTGAVFTGTITVPPGTENGHAVRKDQVALLNGSQPFTAEQRGTDATTATGLVTKQQMDAADNAIRAALPLPNRRVLYSTPGTQTWIVPTGVTKVWLRIKGGGGGGGGGSAYGSVNTLRGGQGGNGGRVSVAMTVTPGQALNLLIGGGGYGSAYQSPSGGGGGGSGSRAEQGATYAIAGGGGGGAGIGYASEGWGTGGSGGAAGHAGETKGSAGGAAGTGDLTTAGGAGGAGSCCVPGAAGGNGFGIASPASMLSTYDESWVFGDAGAGPDTNGGGGGIGGVNNGAGENGGHGSIEIRWYEA